MSAIRIGVSTVLVGGIAAITTGRLRQESVKVDAASLIDKTVSRNVTKPVLDHRNYMSFELNNGLQVLVVEDVKSNKAGFSMAVGAGSFNDPEEFPGLAHFLEHMLFLGTHKYPTQNSFDTFLNQHGGSSNAYTTEERTVYYGDIGQHYVEEALDRFGSFFIEPLLSPEGAGNEVNAVNSEHQKNMPSLFRRSWEVMRRFANPGCPMSKFYTGNHESLNNGNQTTVDALVNFHGHHYKASNMHLVVIANRTVEDLKQITTDYFRAIPQGVVDKVDFSQVACFNEHNLGYQVNMKALGTPMMMAMFPLGANVGITDYKAQALSYMSHALKYDGNHSITHNLRRQNLASGIDLNIMENTADSTVYVIFPLQPQESSDAYQSKVDEVLRVFFAGVNANRQVNEQLYQSLSDFGNYSFTWADVASGGRPSDDASDFAAKLLQRPVEGIISHDYLIPEPDVSKVQYVMDQLRPDNMNVLLSEPTWDEEAHATQHEYWYDILYNAERISDDRLDNFAAADPSTAIPTPELKYVPTNMNVIQDGAGKFPLLVQTDSEESKHTIMEGAGGPAAVANVKYEVWWQGKPNIAIPTVNALVHIKLGYRESDQNIRHYALATMHTNLLNENLMETTADFRACGLSFHLGASPLAYTIEVGGYDQYSFKLYDVVLNSFRDTAIQFEEKDFQRIRTELITDLKDLSSKEAYQWGMNSLKQSVDDVVYDDRDFAAALEKLSLDDVHSHMASIMTTGLRPTVMFFGNIPRSKLDEEGILDSLTDFSTNFTGPVAEQHVRAFPSKTNASIVQQNPIPNGLDSATIYSFQLTLPSIISKTRLSLINLMINRPFFDTLRTEQQLGYVVFASLTGRGPTVEMHVVVQHDGQTADPPEVKNRIMAVMTSFIQDFENMSDEEFQGFVRALRNELADNPLTMEDEAAKVWSPISRGDYCFERQHQEYALVDNLTKPDILETFKHLLKHSVTTMVYGNNIAMPKIDQSTQLATLLNTGPLDDETLKAVTRCPASTGLEDAADSDLPARIGRVGGGEEIII